MKQKKQTKKQKETTIHFVRHGKTDNPKWVVKGHLNFKLSKVGEKQVKVVAKRLSKRKISTIYASPVYRTRQSAMIISKFLPEARVRKARLITEWRTTWQGRPFRELKKTKEWQIYIKKPTELRAGERTSGIATRMEKFCRWALRKHEGEEIVCTSHGDPIKILRLRMQNKSLDRIHSVPCGVGSVTSFHFNGNKLKKITYWSPK